jgi:hypothetical protein
MTNSEAEWLALQQQEIRRQRARPRESLVSVPADDPEQERHALEQRLQELMTRKTLGAGGTG